MDSFLVSVTLRDQPHLQASASNQQTSPNKPSSFFNSMSEIASAATKRGPLAFVTACSWRGP
ncbi:hypothetical protein OS493_039457 [Desmophyllum pertusum]|uniref:Uncharacterized protein n=1 Tax=Desmophyllum pertusum TaxID=174260 RepID=A0A9W9YU34_9CNID|nr:hypothetical protein OS493_039457 [Desmophyllum pertusum]